MKRLKHIFKLGWKQVKHNNKVDKIFNQFYFRVSGSIFSRDSSIIHLLVNAMNSSRAVVQKPVTVVIIPAIQFLCVAMAFLVYLIRKLNRGVSCEVNKNPYNLVITILLSSLSSLKQKLDKFISEINQLQSNQQTYSVQKTIKARISKTLEQQISSSNQESQVETRGELLLDKTPSESSKTKQILDDNKRLMQVATFAAVAFVYVQFCFLLYFTSLTQFRIGFVFLLACAFYISYIYLKVIKAFRFSHNDGYLM